MHREIPYDLKELHTLEDDFRHVLEHSGQTLVRHRPVYTDPSVLKQRWIETPDGISYDETTFYEAFDHYIFRQSLRFLLANPAYTSDQLLTLKLSQEQFIFLKGQEFLMNVSSV